MKAVAEAGAPDEILLVVDSLTGQDAVNVAQSFSTEVALTGVILTRMDGDARGGAALSMRAVTKRPIKFAGTGEKLDALEEFVPDRCRRGASSAWATSSGWSSGRARRSRRRAAEKLAAKMAKGQFDMDDLRMQLQQMKKMGGLGALAGMIPGLAKAKAAAGAPDEKVLGRMEAMIGSMTPKERTRPDLINAKRKIRIAKGSGTTVQDVNKLMKMHQEMEGAMKRLRKMGGMKGMAAMLGKMGGGGAGGMAGLAGMLGGNGLGGGQGGLPGNFNKLNKKR